MSVEEKPDLNALESARASLVAPRVEAYLQFFLEVAKKYPFENDVDILLDLEDKPTLQNVPIFSFQKSIDDKFILLPDVDCVSNDFYESSLYHDRGSYNEKMCKAIFVGSTSGSFHTQESVGELRDPRLQAGVYFSKREEVDFELPNICQCVDDSARSAIKQLGFGSERYVPWQEQLSYKFLLSLDGNGATCSRVFNALKSKSVLMKYNSNQILHYFPTLVPWLHFIPIAGHGDVSKYIKTEAANENMFKYITDAGRDFHARYLGKDYAMVYTYTLLSRFGRLLNGIAISQLVSADIEAGGPITHSRAHVCDIGDIFQNGVNPWIGRHGSRLPLEAFHLAVKDKKASVDLTYQIYRGNEPSGWFNAGDLAGTPGISDRINGIEISLGTRGLRLDGVLKVKFTDGSEDATVGENGCFKVLGTEPIECFCLALKRREVVTLC